MFSWLLQLICAFMHLLCLLRIITEACVNTPERLDQYVANPEQYFLLIMNIFNVIYKSMFIRQLWRHKQDICNVANYVASESGVPTGHPKLVTNLL